MSAHAALHKNNGVLVKMTEIENLILRKVGFEQK